MPPALMKLPGNIGLLDDGMMGLSGRDTQKTIRSSYRPFILHHAF